MQKLWRILYSPRSVFDELSSGLQIAVPLVTVLGIVAFSKLVTHPNPFNLVLSPIGWALYMAVLGTGFLIVGKICKTKHTWVQWFGFAAWMQVPLVLVTALDVLLALLNFEPREIHLFTVGEGRVALDTSSISWIWSYIISIHGLRSWTSKNIGPCIGLALLPHVLLVLPFVLLFLGMVSFINSWM